MYVLCLEQLSNTTCNSSLFKGQIFNGIIFEIFFRFIGL